MAELFSKRSPKRVVIWGTGFVGKMVIAEIVKHPQFELVGVGVTNLKKVGLDVGEVCGLAEPVGVTATDDVDALIAVKPDALVHLRTDRSARRGQHRFDDAVPACGHRRVLDGDDAMGVADHAPEPAQLDPADHRSVRVGRVVLLHQASTRASPTTCFR